MTDNPRINQCMSCSYFYALKGCSKGEDIGEDSFCYEYDDLEETGPKIKKE